MTASSISSIAHINLAKGFRGGERQTVLLIKHLKIARPDLRQVLICHRNSALPAYLEDVPDLDIVPVAGALGGHFSGRVRADIYQAHEAKACHWAAIHRLLFRTPFVICRRVPQLVRNNMFNRFVYRTAAATVSISQSIRESVIRSFGRDLNFSGRIFLIYDAITHQEADPARVAEIRKGYAGHPVFGHIGAYVDRHKGQRILIAAAREFVRKHPEARFVLLGAGADEETLRAESADVPQIEWAGFKNDVMNYIECMDYFVFPSRNEGLGSVLLDIMDHSIPVIASDADGIPEVVIHNRTGLLFPNGDSAALLAAMERLYGNTELKQTLTAGAAENLAKFAPEHMADRYWRLYQDILEGRIKS
ncbi:glycosyltransferase family 4 protein [Succinimonas amylolytica]|uniref:glycosyltransferase family 4 protein n=1 Tax=Succinimonas amylolytica TaxID=83769 RepID=UPI0023A86415